MQEGVNVVNWVKFQFPSMAANISFARACSAAFITQLDCTIEEIDETKLAVSEAISNCVIHGYHSKPDGIIDLEIKLFPNRVVEIIIEDHGRGIENVEKALQPAFSSEPDRMGLGFVFMKSFTDNLEVCSSPGQGTRVRMVKSFAADNSNPEA